ncbi:MAG: nuclear transport factor 2 family protein [Phycisphaerae bacterium]|nr:nuclear transport factor 2 family protein [Gemmatimonadaceae bacterium]
MYHAIVRRLTRRMFTLVNNHGYDEVLSSCAPNIYHRFGGTHALSGERHDAEGLRRWFARLGRLVPTLHLDIREMWIKGFPWNTTVIVRWVGTAQYPDGSPYHQHGVHIVALRWGKVTAIDANEDSQEVNSMMIALALGGVTEATATPILS